MSATRCKLPLAWTYVDQRDWLLETLMTGDFPDFDHIRLYFMFTPTYGPPTKEDLEIALRVMSEDTYRSDKHLSEYDSHALRHDMPLMRATIFQRRKDYANKWLPHAPLSLNLLDMAEEPLLISHVDEGRLKVSVVEDIKPEDALDYARRSAQASPYKPGAWSNLLGRLMQNNLITQFTKGEPYRVNAVVYSDHTPELLVGYLTERVMELDAYQLVSNGDYPAEVKAYYEGVDEERDMICPIIRTLRLVDMQCAGRVDDACKIHPIFEPPLALIEQRVKEQNLCVKERQSPATSLLFSPMPLPEFAN